QRDRLLRQSLLDAGTRQHLAYLLGRALPRQGRCSRQRSASISTANVNLQNELRSVAHTGSVDRPGEVVCASRCFSLFFPKFTASDSSFRRKSWASGGPASQKQREGSLLFAVSRCSLGEKCANQKYHAAQGTSLGLNLHREFSIAKIVFCQYG